MVEYIYIYITTGRILIKGDKMMHIYSSLAPRRGQKIPEFHEFSIRKQKAREKKPKYLFLI